MDRTKKQNWNVWLMKAREELEIKPTLINKAIKIAHKGDWQAHADAFDDLETLVVTVGKDK